jgi:hypothetical protein
VSWSPSITYRTEEGPYWDRQAITVGTNMTDAGSSNLSCNRLQLEFTRTVPTGLRDDRMSINFHIGKTVGGGLYSKFLTGTECAVIEALFDTWFTAAGVYIVSPVTLVAYRWHVVDADEFDVYGGADPVTSTGPASGRGGRADRLGPALRVTGRAASGTGGTSRNADQVSMTTTFRTASRKHWGRVYLPGPNATQISGGGFGRFANTMVDAEASAMRTLINGISSAGYELGVWSTTGRAFLTVAELRVDDVPDIIRRRRAKQVNYAKSYTA